MTKMPVYVTQTIDEFYNNNCRNHFEEFFKDFYIPIYKNYQSRHFQMYLKFADNENEGKYFIHSINSLMIVLTKSLSEFNVKDFDNLKPVSGPFSNGGNSSFRNHISNYIDSIMIDYMNKEGLNMCQELLLDGISPIALPSADIGNYSSLYYNTFGDDIGLLDSKYKDLMYLCQSFYYDTQSKICTSANVTNPFIGTYSNYCIILMDLFVQLLKPYIGKEITNKDEIDKWCKIQIRDHRKFRRRMSLSVCEKVTYGTMALPSLLKF